MGADVDVAELHLSIKDYFTRQPYITADGQTSLDMPYESIEVTDVMYEPKVGDISTAKLTLPSLIAFPGLRPLLQSIKEGNRVEIFANQPDCGDPVFAGFIPPEGIEEQDGKVILNVQDTLGQLKWQHIRRFEYYNQNASAFLDRARSVWADLVADDFSGPTAQNPNSPQSNYFNYTGGAPAVVWGGNFVQVKGTGSAGWQASQTGSIRPASGDVYWLEGDFLLFTAFGASAFIQAALLLQDTTLATPRIGGFLTYQTSGVGAFPQQQASDIEIYPPSGPNYDPGTAPHGTNQVSFSMPTISRHLAVFIQFLAASVTVYVYIDNVQVAFTTQPFNYSAPPGGAYAPTLYLQANNTGDYVTCTAWRVRRLVPALLRAGRFNPQTADAVTYQPNNEDNLQLLQLFAEKDNAEYRPIYRAWPQFDELELDAVTTLGKFASRTLGYEQPSGLPTEGSPQASPLAVIADGASFLTAPPFRFEEGYNLSTAPRTQPRANAHANDVIRVGSSTADAQVFAEKWADEAAGFPINPGALNFPPAYPSYPYFEQITNDDRVGIQGLNAALAGFELARRIDPTPSLELQVVDEVPWAFRWRAGDQVFVKTQSLRTNLEQEMRVQKVQYRAGSPLRTVTMGKNDWDPTMLRLLAEDTKMSWLYDQSGTNPGIYVYPSTGSLLSGATSAVFSIPLDQYTTGSAIVYAALHWFTDANVMNIQPFINGTGVYTTGLVSTSGTDSGLVIVTQYLQSPGTYQLQFKNNDGSTRSLTGAFLVLRIKA